jgi:hypothetical protein
MSLLLSYFDFENKDFIAVTKEMEYAINKPA